MHPLAHDFDRIFEGHRLNYGVYKLTGETEPTGKKKGRALSLRGHVTPDLWSKHLLGIEGIGIIPITDESCVKFAAIDVDVYDLNLAELAKTIKSKNFPLVLCRTKSGGAHLYLFLRDWAPARLVQQKMRDMAVLLGFGNAEIFPKQHTILASRGDIGQWINMPYFPAEGGERYAINEEGAVLSAAQFVTKADSLALEVEQLATLELNVPERQAFFDGPPCLNVLAAKGFELGTRNNGLFNVGIYLKKVFQDTWETKLEEANRSYMQPPLSNREVETIKRSLRKPKNYLYTCKQQPLCAFCNSSLCRTRKYGIGMNGAGLPIFGTLTKVLTNPPIWFVDVEGGHRIELTTEELQYLKKFQTRCMEVANVLPIKISHEQWSIIVQTLLEDVTFVEVSSEATVQGQLRQYLEDFCTSRVSGKSAEELLLGKPWTNNRRTYFRLRDFLAFLKRMKFEEIKTNRIAVYLHHLGANRHFFNVKGRGVSCYSVPEFARQETPFTLPDFPENKI